MATRSTISLKVECKDGLKNYRTIYCHFDGYLSNNGKILLENYDTFEKVEKLLDLGDLRSLGTKLTTDEHHSALNPQDDVCIAYGRDRGETDTNAQFYFSMHYAQKENYNYVFQDGEWYYFLDDDYKNMDLVKNTVECMD